VITSGAIQYGVPMKVVRLDRRQESGYAKIAEKNVSLISGEDVNGFDITMDDARLVDVGKCNEEFADDDNSIAPR
jgi:hypothetical protein